MSCAAASHEAFTHRDLEILSGWGKNHAHLPALCLQAQITQQDCNAWKGLASCARFWLKSINAIGWSRAIPVLCRHCPAAQDLCCVGAVHDVHAQALVVLRFRSLVGVGIYQTGDAAGQLLNPFERVIRLGSPV